MTRYGREKHTETLLRLHARWQQALDDQRQKADAATAAAARTKPGAGKPPRAADAASTAPLNRHVDTDGS